MTARKPPREGIRCCETWRCTGCGHLVPRDLVDFEAPEHCRGAAACTGRYVKSGIWEEQPEWEGGIEARDRRMLESSTCVASCDARYWAKQRAKG